METSTAIQRYNLPPPVEQDLIVSLERLVKADEARRIWAAARGRAGLRPSGTLTMVQFDSALQQLKQEKGVAMIAASSMLIRLKSFRTLSILHTK